MTVLVDEVRPDVVRVTLNRPNRLNAMTAEMIADLSAALRDIAAGCRVVVLTGAGRGFCAGLDLDGYRSEPDVEVEEILKTQLEIAGVMQSIRRLPQPVVAVVNGPAAGGGLGLVCACDLRIATAGARFAASFVKAGYSGCDMGVSWMLPRLIGAGRAHELMLTGRVIDAEESLRAGLVSQVVPMDEVDARLDLLLDELLAVPPLSLQLTKQGMWSAVEAASFDQAIEYENRQQVVTAMSVSQRSHLAAHRERITHAKD
jgi:enoyl-CoA hydratase